MVAAAVVASPVHHAIPRDHWRAAVPSQAGTEAPSAAACRGHSGAPAHLARPSRRPAERQLALPSRLVDERAAVAVCPILVAAAVGQARLPAVALDRPSPARDHSPLVSPVHCQVLPVHCPSFVRQVVAPGVDPRVGFQAGAVPSRLHGHVAARRQPHHHYSSHCHDSPRRGRHLGS